MTIRYRFDEELSLILTEGSGVLTDAELLDYATAVRSDPTIAAYDELVDLGAVEGVEVTANGLRRLAARVKSLNPDQTPYRVAVVAPSDAVYGLTRMYEVFRETSAGEVRAFRNITDARSWLEQP